MAAMGDVRPCWWTLTAALAILVAGSGAAGVEGVCSRMHYAYPYFLSTFRGHRHFGDFFLVVKDSMAIVPQACLGKETDLISTMFPCNPLFVCSIGVAKVCTISTPMRFLLVL
jgi:hypothetical protein